MSSAAILVLEPDPEALALVEDELRRRYSADYEVVAVSSSDDGLRAVERLDREDRELALVLAGHGRDGADDRALLLLARRLHPQAKRALLISWGAWGDGAVTEAIIRAVGRGEADFYLLRPYGPRDEQFHAIVSEAIYDWSRTRSGAPSEVWVVGAPSAARSAELRDILTRNRVHHEFVDADSEQGGELLRRVPEAEVKLPVMELLDGKILSDPTDAEFAEAFGLATEPQRESYDVVVVGAGPAGLSAAVYGASEGLSTLLVETRAVGGQAGASSLIRNYMGFPRGVSGAELAAEAYQQAWALGAESVFMTPVTGLAPSNGGHLLEFSTGAQVRAAAVVAATGAAYRRLGVPEAEAFLNAGVFYGAASAEAQAMRGEPVCVVGGANSAGQAALHLARFASRVTLLVRGEALEQGMSSYLIRAIGVEDTIEVRLGTRLVGASGADRLERVTVEDGAGARAELPVCGVFVLIGAEPRSDWLPEAVAQDGRGFVLTGEALLDESGAPPARWTRARRPASLETSLPGVFAAGDIRSGSVKRVASAVGEGSIAIQQLHAMLDADRIEAGG